MKKIIKKYYYFKLFKMSGITQILDSIFQNNGGTTKQWRTANEILLTQTSETKKYVSYMKNKIRDLNKDVQLLALDFLDYSIDDGKMPLWTQVGSKDFLQSLVNIYKTRNDEEVQEKILYLIKKWANKYFDALYDEVQNLYEGEMIKTLYIGGGTPSMLNESELEQLDRVIKSLSK